MADGSAGLAIIDVSSPAEPELLVNIDTGGDARGVAVSDSYAYIFQYTPSLVIVDISDPTRPDPPVYNIGTYGHVRGVAVSGSYAHVADGIAGLTIIDVSDPASSDPPVYNVDIDGYAYAVSITGSYAYVANYVANSKVEVAVVDIRNPTEPMKLDANTTAVNATDLVVNGMYVYMADENNQRFSILTRCDPLR